VATYTRFVSKQTHSAGFGNSSRQDDEQEEDEDQFTPPLHPSNMDRALAAGSRCDLPSPQCAMCAYTVFVNTNGAQVRVETPELKSEEEVARELADMWVRSPAEVKAVRAAARTRPARGCS
jgi:hypothetical protein